MKTIKEIEKDLMQQDMQKILNKYHNGVYEKEARILQARQNAEASVPFREKIIRRFGIFNRTKEYYESFPQELWEKMIKQDYVRRLCVRAIGTAIIMLYAIYSLFDYLRFTELPELLKAAGGNRLFIVTPIILLLAICGAVAFYCITRGQNKELLGGSLYAVSCGMLALYGAIAAAFGFWIVSQAGFCALLLGPNSIWLTDILALAITGLLPAICKVGMSAVLDPQTIDEFYYSMRKQNAACENRIRFETKKLPSCGEVFLCPKYCPAGCLLQQSAGFLRCRRFAWRGGFAAAGDFRCRRFALRGYLSSSAVSAFFSAALSSVSADSGATSRLASISAFSLAASARVFIS